MFLGRIRAKIEEYEIYTMNYSFHRKMRPLIWCQIILFITSFQCNNSLADDDPYNSTSARLIGNLFKKYNKRLRPVLHPAEPLTVYIYGAPYQIINVDQKRNLISISAHFEMNWQDAYLQWNPDDYDGVENVLLPASAIWTPEVFVYYSTDKRSVIESVLNVEVNHTGYVHNFVPFSTETICPIDVKYFPFDKQHCVIWFDTWPPNGRSVRLELTTSGHNLEVEDFYDSQEWMLINFSLVYDNTSATNKTNVVAMHLIIERQSFYYIFNLVIPSALISIVSVIGFHLPSASTGSRYTKSRLGMMTLLSMSVLLLSVVNELPKFAFESVPGKKGSFSSIPLIGVYYFSLLTIISLATITSSWLVVLEKQVIREGIPIYLRWLVVEEWPWFRNRCKKMPSKECEKSLLHENDSMKCKRIRQKTGSVDTLELADLYEPEIDLQMNNQKSDHKTGTVESNEGRNFVEEQNRTLQHEKANIALVYKDIKSNLIKAVQLLEAIKLVLGEPMAQSKHKYAGVVVKRLETVCLIIYLYLITLVLLMFFFWRSWYV